MFGGVQYAYDASPSATSGPASMLWITFVHTFLNVSWIVISIESREQLNFYQISIFLFTMSEPNVYQAQFGDKQGA